MTEKPNDGFCWMKSRQTLQRLFAGYYKDFGADASKIIRTIIDVLGGCRITIPGKLSTNKENTEAILTLYSCLCERFGKASGRVIMQKFLLELKDCRISFPDYDDIYREERNQKIRKMFKGGNYKELSILFNLAVNTVWEIVNED